MARNTHRCNPAQTGTTAGSNADSWPPPSSQTRPSSSASSPPSTSKSQRTGKPAEPASQINHPQNLPPHTSPSLFTEITLRGPVSAGSSYPSSAQCRNGRAPVHGVPFCSLPPFPHGCGEHVPQDHSHATAPQPQPTATTDWLRWDSSAAAKISCVATASRGVAQPNLPSKSPSRSAR